MQEPTAVEKITINAPASDIWSYRLDFLNLCDYNPGVSNLVQVEQGDSAGVGARYRFDLDSGGDPHPVELWVTDTIESQSVSVSMKSGLNASEIFSVKSSGDNESEVTLSLWLELPPNLDLSLVEALSKSGKDQLKIELELIKEILESRQSR